MLGCCYPSDPSTKIVPTPKHFVMVFKKKCFYNFQHVLLFTVGPLLKGHPFQKPTLLSDQICDALRQYNSALLSPTPSRESIRRIRSLIHCRRGVTFLKGDNCSTKCVGFFFIEENKIKIACLRYLPISQFVIRETNKATIFLTIALHTYL